MGSTEQKGPTNVLIDMCGRTCGWLTVLEKTPARKGIAPHWRCVCRCGKRVVVSGSNLRKKNTRSCGCLVETCKEIARTAVADFMKREFGD